MTECTHHWQQIGVDLYRPAIQVRCKRCLATGEVLNPTPDEFSSAFYASESTPIDFDDWHRAPRVRCDR